MNNETKQKQNTYISWMRHFLSFSETEFFFFEIYNNNNEFATKNVRKHNLNWFSTSLIRDD